MNLRSHGIVALICNQAGQYLLLEDARLPMKGYWAPPHGRCEEGDVSEENAIIREVQEETGLLVQPIRKILTQAADTKVRTVSFWLVEYKGENSMVLNDESSRSGWFTIDEALGLQLYPGTQILFEKAKIGEISLA